MTWAEEIARAHDDLLDIFGETVTYDPLTASTFSIEGDFQRPHDLVDLGGNVPSSVTAPYIDIKLADLPSGIVPTQGHTITRPNAEVYEVSDAQPDGHGMTRLTLIEK